MNVKDTAQKALQMAQKAGAQQVACGMSQAREVEVEWRDGQLQKLSDATTRALGLQLYVDGRYSAVSTSDLREQPLQRFVEEAVAMTRLLAPDPFRTLPEPELYEGQSKADLQLFDAHGESIGAEERLRRVQALETGARETTSAKDAERILSVTTGFSDSAGYGYRIHSNGFEGEKRHTSFWLSANVSLKDDDGRRPEEGDYAGGRFLADLPDPVSVGRSAATRARARLGAKKLPSATVPVVFDNRAAVRFLSYFLSPLSAAALQQQRSYFEGKQGTRIASALLTLVDDPLLVRGLGSRHFDGEGMAARRLPIVKDGVLENFYVDTYYGKKLKMRPTTSGTSNLVVSLGSKTQRELIAEVGEGIFVTGFLGGNSNGTTGDFSLGIAGHKISKGQIAEPIAEMNVSGNHLQVWQLLKAAGNDPYKNSSLLAPSLRFDALSVAGL